MNKKLCFKTTLSVRKIFSDSDKIYKTESTKRKKFFQNKTKNYLFFFQTSKFSQGKFTFSRPENLRIIRENPNKEREKERRKKGKNERERQRI